MKLMSSLLALIGLFALAVDLSHAQESGQGMPFEAIDLNGDGSLTKQELSEFSAKMFARIDIDGNGSLSEQEITEAARNRAEERGKKRFALADEDGNGVVDQSEFTQRREKRQAMLFNRFDANSDGLLSRDEAEDAWKARRSRD
ncbi:MAG: hypothetical protein AAGA26_02880 [Pseudomonadota bacterium]